MRIFKILTICAVTLIATSCGSVSNVSTFDFDSVRLEMGMEDLEYLGETEISVDYTTYIGFIQKVEKVNGETYNPVHKRMLHLPGDGHFRAGKLNLAAYKLEELYPDAVYFQIVYETKESERLFLGSVNKVKAKVRAYNLKKYREK